MGRACRRQTGDAAHDFLFFWGKFFGFVQNVIGHAIFPMSCRSAPRRMWTDLGLVYAHCPRQAHGRFGDALGMAFVFLVAQIEGA